MEGERQKWKSQKSATLKDVAKLAGVSESLASRAINGNLISSRISPVTRESVLGAAELLGYRPNEVARSLHRGRTNRLGVYSGIQSGSNRDLLGKGELPIDASNVFFGALLAGMCKGCNNAGMELLIHSAGNSEAQLEELVASSSVDGLLIFAVPNDPLLNLLEKLRMPAVAMSDRVPGIPSVSADDQLGGKLQARYLAQKGHRHVILKQSYDRQWSTVERMNGFAEEAKKLQMQVSWSFETPGRQERLNDDDLRLITGGAERPTAYVDWNDSNAHLACEELVARGFAIPQDLAVVGFDGINHPYPLKYDLTTVKADWPSVGRRAAEVLSDLISGKTVPNITRLPVEFHPGSTA